MIMEERIEYIKDFLENIHQCFPEIKFRCEFNPMSLTYIIEVIPLSSYTANEEYREKEYSFIEEFESKFPEYIVMFVSDDSLTKIKSPILEIGYYTITIEDDSFCFTFDDSWIINNNYALAA